MHYFELLNAQTRFFPDGSIRAFAPVPKEWSEIDVYLRREEMKSRERIETAIFKFIADGTWPDDLSDRDRVFTRGRLDFGMSTALRFSVPIASHMRAPETPDGAEGHDILTWLLLTQWETLGLTYWITDLEVIFRVSHSNLRTKPKSSPDWFSFGGREIRPPGF
jgi:hypothetical protein